MVRFLKNLGFTVVRIHGSHHVMTRNQQQTSVPVHANKTLKIGTLHGVLRDIEMSATEFEKLWNA